VEKRAGRSRECEGVIILGLTSLEKTRRVYLDPTCRIIRSSVP
jgi:hypothetical protein